MGKLAAFLASFFTSISGWLFSYFSSKVAYGLAALTVSAACLAALFVAFKSLVGLLVLPAAVYPWYGTFVMAFFACWPSNAETCLALCWSADILLFLYNYRARLISLVTL